MTTKHKPVCCKCQDMFGDPITATRCYICKTFYPVCSTCLLELHATFIKDDYVVCGECRRSWELNIAISEGLENIHLGLPEARK